MFLTNNLTQINKSPDDDFWYTPFNTMSSSGMLVTPDTALAVSAVYACCKVISETVAQLPLLIYEQIDESTKRKAVNHPLYRILHSAPNENQTSYEWREMMVWHTVLRGNGYSEIINTPRGHIDQIIPLNPDDVTIEKTGKYFVYRVKDGEGQVRTLTRGEVLHLKNISRNGITGINPLEVEREAIGASLAAQEYSSRFFKNDGRPPGWIEHPDRFKDVEQRTAFRESWQASQTGANKHKVAVLEHGMKYHELKISNEDAQFIETRKYNVEDIARIFRVPPHKIGHLERSTNNNIEHQSIEFVTDTIAPWLVRFEQLINKQLIVDNHRYYAEFLVDGLLRGDISSRYSAYSTGVNTGFLTRNEVRAKENMNPLPGLDEPLEPLNMSRASEQRNNEREKSLVQNASAVVAKRELSKLKTISQDKLDSFYIDHAKYVSRVLAIPLQVSKTYCEQRQIDIYEAIDSGDIASAMNEKDLINKLVDLCNTF